MTNSGMPSTSQYIELYPSNWLYNASVIGFLKVIAYGEGESYVERNMLMDDGRVRVFVNDLFLKEYSIGKYRIPVSLKYFIDFIGNYIWQDKYNKKKKNIESEYKELINKWYDNKTLIEEQKDFALKYIFVGNKLFASNCPYQNLINKKEWQGFEFAELIFEMFDRAKDHSTNCALCNEKLPVIKTNSKLEVRLTTFQHPHMPLLGPSIGEFPNAFWNLKHSFRVCPLCAYLIIHHHIPFERVRVEKYQIFINANSFKVMWYLNKFAEKILSQRKKYQLKQILGLTLVEYAQRIHSTLGAWSIMNIEMVIKRGNTIDYYTLPTEVSRILLNREISSLITKINDTAILNVILEGDFDKLLEISHYILKGETQHPALSELKGETRKRSSAILLSELYAKIESHLRGGNL